MNPRGGHRNQGLSFARAAAALPLLGSDFSRAGAGRDSGLGRGRREEAELMINEKQKGSIINISSSTGLNRGQSPGALAYVVSKTGLNSMTKVMAMELRVHNIRVNSISPGLFKSEMTEALIQKKGLKNLVLKTYPLRTLVATNLVLTWLIRYLIHDSFENVSGNEFSMDMGATLPGVPIFSSL